MLIKPVSFITGVSLDYLTEITIVVNTESSSYGVNPRGGIEDEIDGDGGLTIVSAIDATILSPSTSMVFDVSGLNILWDDRYNYRFGFANIYKVLSITMDKNLDVDFETQSVNWTVSSASDVTDDSWYGGINLNPSNRIQTDTKTITMGYHK